MVSPVLNLTEEKQLSYLLPGLSNLLNTTVIVQEKEAIHSFM